MDFSATWCGPCKMLAPVLEQVSEEFAGQINFFNIDVDENENAAQEYGIMSVPALAVIKDGQKIDMMIGFQPKEILVENLKKYI